MARTRLKLAFADFVRAPRAFMEKFGASVGGFFGNAGTALLYIFGVLALSPRILAAAFFNTLSPCSLMLFGHRNAGIIFGSICAIIGTFLAIYPEIADGEVVAIFGFSTFCVFALLNIFSVPLTHRFRHAKKSLLRHTFGHPRRLAGLGPFFFTRLPIIYESIGDRRWHTALVFAVWGIGDIALSFSRVELKGK